MGFRYRKSFRIAPGMRMTVSKSGVGYSVSGRGMRVTKRAGGGVQTTVGVPGTGLSYTSYVRRRTSRRNAQQLGTSPPAASRRQPTVVVPMTRRIKTERMLCLIGFLSTLVGFAVPPLLLFALPCVLTGLIMMLLNIKDEMRWYRENQAAKAQRSR